MSRRAVAPLALAVVVVAVSLVVLVGRGHGPTVVASFTDVRGLVRGADVRIAGVRVGRVQRVDLDDAAMPRVTMSLDPGIELHRGVTTSVRLASLSGEFNRYVALDDGGGPRLGDRVELGARATRSPVEFDEALQAMAPRTRADVRAVMRELADTARARGAALAATLQHSAGALATTAEAVRQVDSDGVALKRLVASSAAVSSSLASGRDDVGRALDQTAGVLAISARRASELRSTAASLPAALRSANGAMVQAQGAIPVLRKLVRTSAPGVRQLRGVAANLDPLLRAAGPLFTQAAATAQHAPGDMRSIRTLLTRTEPFTRQVSPVLRRLGPMLDQSRVRLPDFFSFFSNWADFTANYDANGHGARVGIVLPPTSVKTLPPDSNAAGQLAPPFLRTPGALEGDPWRDYAKSFVAGGAAAADTGRGQ